MGIATKLTRRWSRTAAWEEPADLPWKQATFCVIDLETTGLDLRRDEIISVGAVQVHVGRIAAETLYRLVRPSCAISAASIVVHSILPGEVEDCPPIGDVLDDVRRFADGAVLVAHSAWIERAFLDRALRPRGERLPATMIDTAGLAKSLDLASGGDREPSLEYLARCLDLPAVSPHHALGDAITTAMTMMAMVAKLEERGEDISVGGLARLSR